MQAFYEAINICQPSFIRVESDEVTYPMHIILRYEIEKGILKVRMWFPIPGRCGIIKCRTIWDLSCDGYGRHLQDVHWSGGALDIFLLYIWSHVRQPVLQCHEAGD